ncbi:MAG TPA: hypothetical protein VFZ66_09850 [Herpetosiphonaceae bacterium]
MTNQESQEHQEATDEAGLVTLQVQIRPEHIRRLRALAAREGATPEALAALMLEEVLDAAAKNR